MRPAFCTLDRTLTWLAFAAVSLLMFLPMVLVAAYIREPADSVSSGAAEATVGIGVILRAIGRRLFRAGARNVVRLTFGTMTRALSRAAISRTVRILVRSSAAGEMKNLAEDLNTLPGSVAAQAEGKSQPLMTQLGIIILGFVATACSFCGVFYMNQQAMSVDWPLSLVEMVLWASVPILFMWLAAHVAKGIFHVVPWVTTGLDGLGIQAYFTLSGSFLPMTTDLGFRGETKAKAHASTFVLLTLLVAFGLLQSFGEDHASLQFGGAMFLTYAFIYAFPLHPMLGYGIWAYSKVLWFGTFASLLICFLFFLRDSFASLL